MGDSLAALPQDLFVSKLPNGEKEFFCFIRFPKVVTEQAGHFSWRITTSNARDAYLQGERSITDKEREQNKISISAALPREFEAGELTVNLAFCEGTWRIRSFEQKDRFRLPLEGQVFIAAGHRIGELHRSASILSEHFA